MICPRCQTINQGGARFCSNCGQALEAAAASRQPEGERKLVTVLFADVAGSTAMGERLDPEQVTDVMNGAFAFMNQAVDKYGGTVARLMGDAVLAIFGAPVAHEDDPERAVRAGLDIQMAARDYARAIERQYGIAFHLRVGIHTGLGVVDQVGDHIRTEYTVMGDTPNVASRMQSSAEPGSVLVSADTHRLVRHAFDFMSRGPLEARGKSAPIDTWQVIGPRAAPLSARGLQDLHAPMVGRQNELERLQQRLAALRPGAGGSWVTVSGEAGLGKSRLLAELRHSAAAAAGRPQAPPAPLWLEGRCVSYGQDSSYLPWRQIIRQTIGSPDSEPPEAVRARLEVAACNCCEEPGGDLPFLEAMLAVAGEESLKHVMGYSGSELVERMTAAVRGYLCGQARARPLVLVFEDLHWADTASLDLLENLCSLVPLHPIMIVCLMRRDKDTPAWALARRARELLAAEHVEDIALEPLSADQSRDLLGMLLHIEDLPDPVRAVILERSDGNPFFVEEVIRSLLDTGLIVRQDGRWRATREIAMVSIPTTLAGLLAARIDALPDDTKRLAQMSSVIGRSFALQVIKVVCDSAPPPERLPDIQPPLDWLVRQEIVRLRARQPDVEYAFKHALTQEAAYNSLLIRRRRELHARAGRALEAVHAGRLDEFAPVLAHHYWHAEDWQPAAAWAMRAGAAAQRVYALREAMRHYNRAIEALDRAGEGHDGPLCTALLGWARAAFKLLPYPEQLLRLERAEQAARRLADKRLLAEALHALGDVHLARGYLLKAIPVFMEAFHLAEALGDEALALVPSVQAAFASMDENPRASIALFERAIALAIKYDNRAQQAFALAAMAMPLARLGRSAESIQAINSALQVIQAVNDPIIESDVELFVGWAYLDIGDTAAALEHGERAVQLALEADNFDCTCGAFACVGFGRMQAQQLPEAQAAFQHALERTSLSGAAALEALARGGLALVDLAAGKTEAITGLEAALAQAQALNDPFTTAIFASAAAETHLALGNLDVARGHLNTALEYFERNQLAPYLAQARAIGEALEAARR
jgi:predicted ATPase/class 3 adenylate cyclase